MLGPFWSINNIMRVFIPLAWGHDTLYIITSRLNYFSLCSVTQSRSRMKLSEEMMAIKLQAVLNTSPEIERD